MMFKRSNKRKVSTKRKYTIESLSTKIKKLEKSQNNAKKQINNEIRLYKILAFAIKRYILILTPFLLRGSWFLIFKLREIFQRG